jgi:hypothetical protein
VIDFQFGIDVDLHAENRRRAKSLGETELFYFDSWSSSGLVTDEDMSVALDVYEEEGYREFVRFMGSLLPGRLQVGATVNTRNRLKGYPGVNRDIYGIVREVTANYVEVRFSTGRPQGERLFVDYIWTVGDRLPWAGIPGEPGGNTYSLGDFPVDLEVKFGYRIDDFVYDLGLGPDEAFESKQLLWELDEVEFFEWFTTTYNLPVKTLSVGKDPYRKAKGLLRYVDTDLPNTLILIDELIIDIAPLEETIDNYYGESE